MTKEVAACGGDQVTQLCTISSKRGTPLRVLLHHGGPHGRNRQETLALGKMNSLRDLNTRFMIAPMYWRSGKGQVLDADAGVLVEW